ncbi:hypothetical protein [Streptomyces sp. NPDC047718]|uniref:hypothetical protein n=1 Tax=Streptomyces sp. NPDC047718 TaxID=3155479 RepID=UPI0033D2B591
MHLPFLRRPEPVVDLTTPEARAEYEAYLKTSDRGTRQVVDFRGLPPEPPRHRPRRQYRCPVRIVRASTGEEYSPYE